jgi:MATE family multidrug resistance protein
MTRIADLQMAPRQAWGAEIRATLSLAWPLILTNLAQVAFGATDVVMMGWLGPEALAAGALATNLNFAFLIFGIGLVSATAPMVAIELGRNRHAVREVRRTVRQGLWSAVMVALPIWVVLWQAEPIFLAIGQEPSLAREAAGYLHTLQWSILPFLWYIVLRSFISAVERPLAALWVAVPAVAFNAGAVWCLMFGKLGLPALGLVGAGIGTTLSSALLFAGLAVMISADRRYRRYRLFGRFWRADWPRLADLWRLGLPMAATLGFEVTVFNAAVFLMGLVGADALAAHSIAIQIASLAFMVPLGLGMAASVRVGRAYGAHEWDAATRAGWTAYGLAILYACGTAVFMIFDGRRLVGVFLDLDAPANQPVIRLAMTFIAIAGLFQVVDGAQAIGSGMLRGLGDTRVPMIFAAVGYWGIGMPLAVFLGFGTGLRGVGIWAGLATGLAVVAVLMTGRWIMRDRLGLMRGQERAAPQPLPAIVTPL